MNKVVLKRQDVEAKINKTVDLIADPIKQTLGPKGGNVIIQNDKGQITLTNDGVTIAKSITVSDFFDDTILDVIKTASFKTNSEAGDGTSSTIVLAQTLIKEGQKMLDIFNVMDLKKHFTEFSKKYIEEIKKFRRPVNEKNLFEIAKISANNDTVIASDVARIIKVVGDTGMVFLDKNQSSKETVIEEDLGFKIDAGIPYKELLLTQDKFNVGYTNVPVLLTDKKLYYEQEAQTILKVAMDMGYKAIVIVAKDVIGRALDWFITNHTKGGIRVLFIKDPNTTETDSTSLQDLAIYLGGKVVSERTGTIVNKLKYDDFVIAEKVYADPTKTLITPKKFKNKALVGRVKAIKDELEKDKNNKVLQRRLSSLTNGIVNVKVGGDTEIEVAEKIFRYEDAISATRVAMKEGFVVGGGVTYLRAFNETLTIPELVPLFRRYSETILRQLVVNCGREPNEIIKDVKSQKGNYGYNALTDKGEDLVKAGVIEPLKVVTEAVANSFSIANIIISTNYYIINERECQNEADEASKKT